jgi:hypothetical protein
VSRTRPALRDRKVITHFFRDPDGGYFIYFQQCDLATGRMVAYEACLVNAFLTRPEHPGPRLVPSPFSSPPPEQPGHRQQVVVRSRPY